MQIIHSVIYEKSNFALLTTFNSQIGINFKVEYFSENEIDFMMFYFFFLFVFTSDNDNPFSLKKALCLGRPIS